MAISTHGLVIALLQFAFVLGLLWVQSWWRRKRIAAGRPDLTATLVLAIGLVVEFAVLRYQPIRMGGDPFEYTLGLFDAFSAAGLVMLFVLQRVHRPAAAA